MNGSFQVGTLDGMKRLLLPLALFAATWTSCGTSETDEQGAQPVADMGIRNWAHPADGIYTAGQPTTEQYAELKKAGILRADKPAVFAALDVPDVIIEHSTWLGTDLRVAGRDYRYRRPACRFLLC